MKFSKIIDMLGWFSDSVNGVDNQVKTAEKQLKKIQKIAQEHYGERYNTCWDDMQERLYEIWKLTK